MSRRPPLPSALIPAQAGATPDRREQGSALLYVLFLLAIVAILAGSLLTAAASESRIGGGRRDILTARLLALHAAGTAAARADTGDLTRLATGAAITLDSLTLQSFLLAASIEPLPGGLLLARGEASNAQSTAPPIAQRVGLLLRFPRLEDLWPGELAALVSAGALDLQGAELSDGLGATQPLGCIPTYNARAALTVASADSLTADAATVIQGAVQVDSLLWMIRPPMRFNELIGRADRVEQGALSLSPAGTSTCDESSPGNWGAPEDPRHPCAAYHPLVHAPGDTDLVSGAGQGVLVVDGTLSLHAGVRFYGLIIVRGDFAVADGATITGSVIVLDGRSRVSGRVLFSDCAIARAVTHAPALRRPIRADGRRWLPLY